jgi:hypothetical protein
MTTTVKPQVTPTDPATTTTPRPRWSADRKTAFWGGAFYLITFASSIPAMFLLGAVLDDPNYIVSGGADTRVTLGAMLDLVNALTAVATAVVLFRVVKRQYETLALGFVTTRMFEAAVIVIGVVGILTLVSLRNPAASGGEAESLMTVGQSLVATYDWTFLLGPNIMAALNALMLATIMYKSGLVPRVIPALGLVGAPLILAVSIATIFGLTDHGSVWWAVAAPIFLWELSLGAYLVVKGFRRTAITPDEVTLPAAS